MIRSHLRVCLLLGIVVLIGGCGRGPKLVPVTGTVNLDGKPLADATVNFLFTDYPRPAVGRTDESGKFTLAYHNRAGAPLGSCTVRIRKQGRAPGEEASRELIPGRYNANTQFKVEIIKDGSNDFPFELSSTPDEADSTQQPQAAPTNEEPPDSELPDEGGGGR